MAPTESEEESKKMNGSYDTGERDEKGRRIFESENFGNLLEDDLSYKGGENEIETVPRDISEIPNVTFEDLPDAKIWFDREQNEWRYTGDLVRIEEEIADSVQYMSGSAGLILTEILRQLKTEPTIPEPQLWRDRGDDEKKDTDR